MAPTRASLHALGLGIFLLKLFSQECICYTSMARKRSAFKEVPLYLVLVHLDSVDSLCLKLGE